MIAINEKIAVYNYDHNHNDDPLFEGKILYEINK